MARPMGHIAKRGTPLANCYLDPHHFVTFKQEIGCSEHCVELDNSTNICTVCYSERINSTIICPIPWDQKADEDSTASPSVLIFGVLGSVGAVASVVSAAVEVCKRRHRNEARQGRVETVNLEVVTTAPNDRGGGDGDSDAATYVTARRARVDWINSVWLVGDYSRGDRLLFFVNQLARHLPAEPVPFKLFPNRNSP